MAASDAAADQAMMQTFNAAVGRLRGPPKTWMMHTETYPLPAPSGSPPAPSGPPPAPSGPPPAHPRGPLPVGHAPSAVAPHAERHPLSSSISPQLANFSIQGPGMRMPPSPALGEENMNRLQIQAPEPVQWERHTVPFFPYLPRQTECLGVAQQQQHHHHHQSTGLKRKEPSQAVVADAEKRQRSAQSREEQPAAMTSTTGHASPVQPHASTSAHPRSEQQHHLHGPPHAQTHTRALSINHVNGGAVQPPRRAHASEAGRAPPPALRLSAPHPSRVHLTFLDTSAPTQLTHYPQPAWYSKETCLTMLQTFIMSQDAPLLPSDRLHLDLLRDAVEAEDWSYTTMHQFYCLLEHEPSFVPREIWNHPCREKAVAMIEKVLGSTRLLSPAALCLFANFPYSWMDIRAQWPVAFNQRQTSFLSFVSASQRFNELQTLCVRRGFPPLASELAQDLSVSSVIFQRALFNTVLKVLWQGVDPDLERRQRYENTALQTFMQNQVEFSGRSRKSHRIDPTKEIRTWGLKLQCLGKRFKRIAHSSPLQQTTQLQPTQLQPTQLQPTQSQPTQSKRRQSRPTQSKRRQSQPTQSKRRQSQPTQSKRRQSQPTQFQLTQVQPTQSQPTQFQPTQLQPTQSQPTQFQPTQLQPTESQPMHLYMSNNANMSSCNHLPPRHWPQQCVPLQHISQQHVPQQLVPQPSNRPGQPLSRTITSTYVLPSQLVQDQPRGVPLLPSTGETLPPQHESSPAWRGLHQAHLRSPIPKALSVESPLYQYVQGFVTPPKCLSNVNQAVEKWSFNLDAEIMRNIPASIPGRPGDVDQRMVDTNSKSIRLRCTKWPTTADRPDDHTWMTADTSWIPHSYFSCNNVSLMQRLKIHHGKDLPIDMTHLVKEGENTLEMTVMATSNDKTYLEYLVAIEVLGMTSHAQIRLDCFMKHHIPAAQVLSDLQNKLRTSNDDHDDITIVQEDFTINVFDPFSTSKICDTPVRSRVCLHPDCFDLDTYLQTRQRKGDASSPDVWRCPICNADARPHLLIVDGFLQEVKSQLDAQGLSDTRAIIVQQDGTWKPKPDLKDADGVRAKLPSLVVRQRSLPAPTNVINFIE